LIYRLPHGLSLGGRSFCPHCKKQIRWFDNIPLLSFIILEGKCRYCQSKISFCYPLLEFTTGIFFLLSWFFVNSRFLTESFVGSYYTSLGALGLFLFLNFLFCLLVPIFIIDYQYQIIPDELIYIGLAVISFLLLIISKKFYLHFFSSFVVADIIWVVWLITKGKGMGLGDVKFALLGGLFFSWPYGFVWLLVSFILGGAVGLVLLVLKKARLKSKISFGPFLVISFFICLIFADKLINLLYLK
jgi:prepilin signal peptidase PulO-like enzyme (type II secretory pathway)